MGKKEEVQRDRGISGYKHNKERVLGAEIQGKIVDKDIKGKRVCPDIMEKIIGIEIQIERSRIQEEDYLY